VSSVDVRILKRPVSATPKLPNAFADDAGEVELLIVNSSEGDRSALQKSR